MIATTTITMPTQRRNFAASTKTPSSRSTTPTISRMIASPVIPPLWAEHRAASTVLTARSHRRSRTPARRMCHDALVDEGSIAELRRLQARAYAPGADIGDDDEALRRLEELEGVSRAVAFTAPPDRNEQNRPDDTKDAGEVPGP